MVRKVGIVGSRSFDDYCYFKDVLAEFLKDDDILVSGGAKGADKLAEKYAKQYGKTIIIHYPNWNDVENKPNKYVKINKYGFEYYTLAGFERNKKIVLDSDLVLAFWDGSSSGTKDTINLCEKNNVKCEIIYY